MGRFPAAEQPWPAPRCARPQPFSGMTTTNYALPDTQSLPSELAEHVRHVVSYVKSHSGPKPRRFHERRHTKRQAYPYLIELTPISDGGVPCGDPLLVLGKHLSDLGLDFYHQGPLPNRRFRARLETGDVEPVELVIEISWCRFIKRGWYESGGRFLRLAASDDITSRLQN